MAEPISFPVDVTTDDVVETQLHQLAQNPHARRNRVLTLALIGVVSTLVIIAAVVRQGMSPASMAVFSVAAVYSVFLQTDTGRRWRARRFVKRAGVAGTVQITLDDDGLGLTADGEARRVAWRALESVVETSAHVMLTFAPGTTVVAVPKRALPIAAAERLRGLGSVARRS